MAQPIDLEDFLASWTIDPIGAKQAFEEFREFLRKQPDTEVSFFPRPGISYSLRAKNRAQKERSVFALIDVVDDNPEERWLSICFYADMVEDPDELGDFVPKGLHGEDAICFNLDSRDEALRRYILDRLGEASKKAAA